MSTFSALGDGLVVAKRNLIKIKRVPDLLVFTTLQPIMFVLLFAFVFGGAIDVEGSNYREFLMAGIFTQTVTFGATLTGAGLAEDMQKGIIDRFRSLPMSRSAVLIGRTLSDLVNNIIVVSVMSLTGLAIGWRIRSSFLEGLAGFALLLLFAYAISWVMAYVGLLVSAPEIVNNAAFIVIFPLTFAAATFAPIDNMPGPLKAFAQWNPVSAVAQGAREYFGNLGDRPIPPSSWALQNPAIYTIGWVILILLIFVPLATRQYARASRK